MSDASDLLDSDVETVARDVWANLQATCAASGSEAKRLVMIGESDVVAAVTTALASMRPRIREEALEEWRAAYAEAKDWPGISPKSVEALRAITSLLAAGPAAVEVDDSDGEIALRWQYEGELCSISLVLVRPDNIAVIATDLRAAAIRKMKEEG